MSDISSVEDGGGWNYYLREHHEDGIAPTGWVSRDARASTTVDGAEGVGAFLQGSSFRKLAELCLGAFPEAWSCLLDLYQQRDPSGEPCSRRSSAMRPSTAST
jgi:hypothetical protein